MRIIVNNNSKASEALALNLVSSVIKMGRISGDSYCYASTFKIDGDGNFIVYATKNNKSDSFRIEDL